MALTPTEEAALAAAEAALSRAADGSAVKTVQHGARRLENHAPDPAALERQIDRLELRRSGGRRRGALRFTV